MDALIHSFSPSGKLFMAAALLLLPLLLASCAGQTVMRDYCQIAHPILLEKGEAAKLSDATARAILTANETWAKVCPQH